MSTSRICGYWLTKTSQYKKVAELVDDAFWKCPAGHTTRGAHWTTTTDPRVRPEHTTEPDFFTEEGL